MTNIKANIDALEGKISKLSALKTECEGIDVSVRQKVGGGKSINALSAIDEEYSSLQHVLTLLLKNSVSFFTNVKNDLVAADDEAAQKMERGGGGE